MSGARMFRCTGWFFGTRLPPCERGALVPSVVPSVGRVVADASAPLESPKVARRLILVVQPETALRYFCEVHSELG
jgi:hypothetical protein